MADTTTAVPPASADPAAPGTTDTVAPRRHLHDVDVVRFTTVLGVLCVHATSLMLADTEVTGAALAILHVTREVFLFLSAFVLGYSTRAPVGSRRFWRRRVPLVLAPYVVWSAIYVLADGGVLAPESALVHICVDLLSGAAHFHLYFLLLTLQLYLVFPYLRAWLGRCRHHGRILVAAFAWQLAFTSAIWFRLRLPAPFSTWLAHPGTWLTSYPLYVIGGILAAFHFDEVRAWVESHARHIAVGSLLVLATVLGLYELDVHLLHEGYRHAGGVFAPGVVLGSCAAIAVQFALGLRVARRAGPRLRRRLEVSSDVSFGVYLAHPLLYMLLLNNILAPAGVTGLTGLPPAAGLALVVLVVAPATWVLTAAAVWLVRRTPLSLALTGRRAKVRAAKPNPAPALA
jgi:peptidoglycan/LPS O-acetylase OafA/YrhL